MNQKPKNTPNLKPFNTTRRKVKIVGKKTYYHLNDNTNEMEAMEFSVVEVEDRDANFAKIWIGSVIASLNNLATSKLKVVFWLIENRTKENYVIATAKDIAAKCNVGLDTVHKTLQILRESNFLTKIGNGGAYQINPDMLFQGGKELRSDVLIRYKNTAQK